MRQLVFYIRFVDGQLNIHEDLLVCILQLYLMHYRGYSFAAFITAEQCRGQCYNGASAMAGCKTGVSTELLQKEPRALYTHCYGHALNLALQETVKSNRVL